MERITLDYLERLVDTINRLTGSPAEPYTWLGGGKYKTNIGNYHMSGAYGGWQLQRMVAGGGTSHVLGGGYISKRELAVKLESFIEGLRYNHE